MTETLRRRASAWHRLLGLAALLTSLAAAGQGSALALQGKPVALVANDWCPQHCEHGRAEHGYIVDIVTQALNLQAVPYTLRYFPWPRAMRMVERGEADGLLTPTVPGFPQYLYHEQAVGYQQYCFYADKASTWRYSKPADLEHRHIAMLADSGLGAVDDYIRAHRSTVTVTQIAAPQDFARRLFLFLGMKRADTAVLTTDAFEHGQSRGDIGPNFRPVGCLAREKLAVGLSPHDKQRSQQIGKALDQGISQLRESGQLAKILARYGLKDWKP